MSLYGISDDERLQLPQQPSQLQGEQTQNMTASVNLQNGQQDFVVRQHQAIPAEGKATSAAAANANTLITTARPTQRPLEDGELMQSQHKRTRLSAFEDITRAAEVTTQTAAQPVAQQTAQPQERPWPQQIQGSQHQYPGQQQKEGQQEQTLQQQQSDAQQLPGSQLPPWLQ